MFIILYLKNFADFYWFLPIFISSFADFYLATLTKIFKSFFQILLNSLKFFFSEQKLNDLQHWILTDFWFFKGVTWLKKKWRPFFHYLPPPPAAVHLIERQYSEGAPLTTTAHSRPKAMPWPVILAVAYSVLKLC